MSIVYKEKPSEQLKCTFKLDTPNTSYVLGVAEEDSLPIHIYYGTKLKDINSGSQVRFSKFPMPESGINRDRGIFLDTMPHEYPTFGIGDYRESCLNVETLGGNNAVGLSYISYEIKKGKGKISGMPASFGSEDEVDELILHCEDKVLGLKIDLIYAVFNDNDVITRRTVITNEAEDAIYLTKVYSACIDMDNRDFELVSLHGAWARERHMETIPLGHQKICVESYRGESSHHDHPFVMLKTPDTTEDHGDVYAMHFVYSGNFKITAANTPLDMVRMTIGISPENFKWKLTKGEIFESPEAVLVYSHEGTGKMTRTFHDFYRNHLIRSPYLHQKRPILINNWEATYFDFNTDKLIAIADQASKLGIEMLVMDDGWFGNRFDDNRALGDWQVNEEKLPGGLKFLVDEVNKRGMKFGIWFEPEMISPESELYNIHPEWAIKVPGRVPTRMRNQYVLDYSRKDVRDYIYDLVAGILHSANIEYVKWDMNRQLSDLGSVVLEGDRMGELSHRYVLGVYELQERLLQEFPNLLLENCSGGGGRFDPGMLYYSPQIWCSDDTDAIERLSIQEGTALVYPLSTMGAHVSDCPNHTVGRTTPFETRGHVALAGTFGYELDVTRIPEEDRNMIPQQVEMYHRFNDLVREGDYYRLNSYRENHMFDCYGVVSKDKKEALYTFVQVLGRANYGSRRIYLKGLDPDKIYLIEDTKEECSGEILMNAGYLVDNLNGDFKSRLIYLREI